MVLGQDFYANKIFSRFRDGFILQPENITRNCAWVYYKHFWNNFKR